MLPSASTLAVLRKELGQRVPARKAVAAFADPVFEAHDERVKLAARTRLGMTKEKTLRLRSHTIARRQFNRALRETSANRNGLPRLPGTRLEAERLRQLVPASDFQLRMDFAANRSAAFDPALDEYRFVHFATHGLLNSQHPELSGVALSMISERGEPQDGYLRAQDVFNLKLRAELVVLSACQTGSGKEIKGEGMIGLTRGFMYAGAPRVVVSLWSVNDIATAELMSRFYELMLKQGMRPAAALRAAQISMAKDKKYVDPFYWAAFVIQGEWR